MKLHRRWANCGRKPTLSIMTDSEDTPPDGLTLTVRLHHPLAPWRRTLIGWPEEMVVGMGGRGTGGLNTQPK